ncbi:MAG: 5'-3' exonuclease H3TH domain-containing protein, partial [Oscillospiraceae bacterium]
MKLLVLDGNSILNRAYYGIKLLSTKDGMFTNGIYGFLNILEKIKEECVPDAIAVAFDLRAPTFRHLKYDGYKAGRKGMPEELAVQMPVLQELLTALGYTLVTKEGFEADDILGTLAKTCEAAGNTCMIATGDRDSLQLVSESTTVRLASTKFGQSVVTLYDREKILADYGVEPKQLIDIKSIQGDSSDNIPGVAGIGEKGAGELIRRFGSLQYIYDHLEELDITAGMRKKLAESKENAFLSYFLGTIDCAAPVDTSIESYIMTPGDPQKAAALMIRLELFKMMEKMGISLSQGAEITADTVESAEIPFEELPDGAPLLAMLEDVGKAYFLSEGKLIYFAIDGGVKAVAPTDIFLKAFAQNGGIEKYSYDIKLFYKTVKNRTGSELQNIAMDTMLAGYLLNPSASGYDVARMAAEYGVTQSNETLDAHPVIALTAALPALCGKLSAAIDENKQKDLLLTMEIPLAKVLGD